METSMDSMVMDNTSSMPVKVEPAMVADNQAWVNGTVLSIKSAESKLTLQHEAVEKWGWPQMKMDFPVAESVNIKVFDPQENYNFLVEKKDSGAIEIIDFNKKVQP